MLVTINTDASHDNDHNLGAYAFWIVSNKFRFKQAGVFKEECPNPTDAEVKAVLNALYVVSLQGVEVSRIIINTDCRPAIALFNHGLKGSNKKYWKNLKKEYHRLIRKIPGKNPKVEIRHVKAHSGVEDARSKVNEWCDQSARACLREARNSLTKK